MLSRQKVAEAITSWLEQQLRDSQGRSLRDDTDGNAVIINNILPTGNLLIIHVSAIDEHEAIKNYEFLCSLTPPV